MATEVKDVAVLHEKSTTPITDEKSSYNNVDVESTEENDSEFAVLENERDIATHVISIEDDPTLNPWTFRAFFIGIGLSAFGGVLGTLNRLVSSSLNFILPFFFFFSGDLLLQACEWSDPYRYLQLFILVIIQQTVLVSTMFLAIIAYVIGMFFETIIPRRGVFRYLNPVGAT